MTGCAYNPRDPLSVFRFRFPFLSVIVNKWPADQQLALANQITQGEQAWNPINNQQVPQTQPAGGWQQPVQNPGQWQPNGPVNGAAGWQQPGNGWQQQRPVGNWQQPQNGWQNPGVQAGFPGAGRR